MTEEDDEVVVINDLAYRKEDVVVAVGFLKTMNNLNNSFGRGTMPVKMTLIFTNRRFLISEVTLASKDDIQLCEGAIEMSLLSEHKEDKPIYFG